MERVGQAPIFPNHQPLGKMASYMNSSFLHLKLNSNNGKSLPNDTRNNNALVSSSSSVSGRCSSHQNLQRTPRKGGGGGGGLENPIFLRSPPCSPKRLLDNGVVNKATTTTTSSQGSTSSTDDGECSSQGDTDEDVAAIKKKCVLSGVNYFCQKHRSNFSQPLNSSSSSHVERNRMDKDFEMEEDTLEVHQNANGFTNGNMGSKRSSLKIQTENHSAIPKRVKKLSWEDEQVFKVSLRHLAYEFHTCQTTR